MIVNLSPVDDRRTRLGDSAVDERCDGRCGFRLHAGHRMCVRVHREGDVCVPKPLADDLHLHASSQSESRMGMAKIVKSDDRESGRTSVALEHLRDPVWVDGAAVLLGEDVARPLKRRTPGKLLL